MCTGMVTLSPMTVATVCRVGDPLQITCTSTVQFIRWSILQVIIISEQEMLVKPVTSAQINSLDGNQMSQIVVNSTKFTFTRTSASGVSPLNTTLSIDSVSIDLNGTVVNCSDVTNATVLAPASTTIQIIDNSE